MLSFGLNSSYRLKLSFQTLHNIPNECKIKYSAMH